MWFKLETFSGITYTPTLIVNYGSPATGADFYLTRHNPRETEGPIRHPHDEIDKWKEGRWYRGRPVHLFLKLAHELNTLVTNGGRVGLGSHGEVQGIGTHWELWMIASGGMKPTMRCEWALSTAPTRSGLGKEIGFARGREVRRFAGAGPKIRSRRSRTAPRFDSL